MPTARLADISRQHISDYVRFLGVREVSPLTAASTMRRTRLSWLAARRARPRSSEDSGPEPAPGGRALLTITLLKHVSIRLSTLEGAAGKGGGTAAK